MDARWLKNVVIEDWATNSSCVIINKHIIIVMRFTLIIISNLSFTGVYLTRRTDRRGDVGLWTLWHTRHQLPEAWRTLWLLQATENAMIITESLCVESTARGPTTFVRFLSVAVRAHCCHPNNVVRPYLL